MSEPDKEQQIDLFVRLSSALIGVAASELKPFADPHKLSVVFYDRLVAEAAELESLEGGGLSSGSVGKLLARFKELEDSGKTGEQIGDAILNPESPSDEDRQQSNLAASIIKMWYLGSWYAPDPSIWVRTGPNRKRAVKLKKSGDIFARRYFGGTVVSSTAYVKGWVWRMAQTHPMGAAGEMGALGGTHGDWAIEPTATLDDMVKGD